MAMPFEGDKVLSADTVLALFVSRFMRCRFVRVLARVLESF